MFNAWPAHASKLRAQRGLVSGATWKGNISFSPLRPQGPGKSPRDRSESQRKAAGPFHLHAERSSGEGCKEGSPRAGRRRGAQKPAAQHPCCRPRGLRRGGEKAWPGWWARGEAPSAGAAGVFLLGPRRCRPHFAFRREGGSAPLGRVWGSFHMSLQWLLGMWEGKEHRPSPSTGQAASWGVSRSTYGRNTCSSLLRTGRGATISPGGGRSCAGLAGTGVSWYTSWAFSRTFWDYTRWSQGRVSGGSTAGPIRELPGWTSPASASFWLRPSWDLFLGPLGLRAGRCPGAGTGDTSHGSGESGPQLTPSLGTLGTTQPGRGRQVSQNFAGGGAGPRAGSGGTFLCPQVTRAHAVSTRR